MSVKFVVTSKNDLKINAVKEILQKILVGQVEFTVEGVAAPSKVSDQPKSLEETKRGAVNRIMNTKEQADYIISVESGVEREFDCFYCFTFCAIAKGDHTRFGFGTSAKFPVPDVIGKQIVLGKEMRASVPNKEGLIATITGGFKTRTQLIQESVVSALMSFNFFKVELPSDVPAECLKFMNDASVTQLEKNAFAAQLNGLDFTPVTKFAQQSKDPLDPAEIANYSEDDEEGIYQNGVASIKAGEVATIIMAGGQGSRLGSPIPKALVELDIPSHSTLLEIQLRRIKRLIKLFSEYNQTPIRIPVYILTSEETHTAIAAYLIEKSNFGLPFVKLVKQDMLPARLPDGKVALRNKSKVLAAPNGNGSIFEALKNSGAIDEMDKMGVKYVEIHPIDNCLARPADPFFVGAMEYEGADAGLKVVKKASPSERAGTVARRSGRTIVVEYTEIPPEDCAKHMYANTAIHGFTLDLIKKATELDLPFHIARKQENIVDEEGNAARGEVVKYERFIFDALELAENVALIEVKREEEFAPVKNAHGAPTDSPETARDLLLAEHRRWAEEAGIKLEGEGALEFSPETTYAGEGLERYADMTFTLPCII